MNISLTPHLEAMIREKVESGRYHSSSEVVQEALRLLDRHLKQETLRAALAVGVDDLARGDVVEWTPKLMAEIWREGKEAAEAGEQPDPNVCPEASCRPLGGSSTRPAVDCNLWIGNVG